MVTAGLLWVTLPEDRGGVATPHPTPPQQMRLYLTHAWRNAYVCSLFRHSLYGSVLWSTNPAYLLAHLEESKACEVLSENSNCCFTLFLSWMHDTHESVKGSEKSCKDTPCSLSLINMTSISLSTETIFLCRYLRKVTRENCKVLSLRYWKRFERHMFCAYLQANDPTGLQRDSLWLLPVISYVYGWYWFEGPSASG